MTATQIPQIIFKSGVKVEDRGGIKTIVRSNHNERFVEVNGRQYELDYRRKKVIARRA